MTHSTEGRTVGPPMVLGRDSPAAGAESALRTIASADDAAVRAEGGSAGKWALRAASVAGVRHRLAGQPGEDSFAWFHSPGRLAVAVSDGLGAIDGSAAAASRAARAAVDAACHCSGDAKAAAVEGLRAANEAARGGGATTLLLGVIDEGGNAVLVRVGDSSAFVVDDDGASWRELLTPPADDGVGTATDALPSDDPVAETASVEIGDGVLAMVTDGVADPWRDGPSTVAPALSRALAGRPSVAEIAVLADFSRQGCHDDRTIVAVWFPEQPGGVE